MEISLPLGRVTYIGAAAVGRKPGAADLGQPSRLNQGDELLDLRQLPPEAVLEAFVAAAQNSLYPNRSGVRDERCPSP